MFPVESIPLVSIAFFSFVILIVIFSSMLVDLIRSYAKKNKILIVIKDRKTIISSMTDSVILGVEGNTVCIRNNNIVLFGYDENKKRAIDDSDLFDFIDDCVLLTENVKNFWFHYISYLSAKYKSNSIIKWFSFPYLIIEISVTDCDKKDFLYNNIIKMYMKPKIGSIFHILQVTKKTK